MKADQRMVKVKLGWKRLEASVAKGAKSTGKRRSVGRNNTGLGLFTRDHVLSAYDSDSVGLAFGVIARVCVFVCASNGFQFRAESRDEMKGDETRRN